MEKNFDRNNENCVEWLNGQQTITVTLCEQKYINKINRYKESHASDVEILSENSDGSICVKLPKRWLKLSPPRQMSNEQKEAASARFKKMREDKNSV